MLLSVKLPVPVLVTAIVPAPFWITPSKVLLVLLLPTLSVLVPEMELVTMPVVLLAVLLHGELYGRELRDRYAERTRTDLPLGSLYVTLDRMADKGLLTSRMGESAHERGGNRRWKSRSEIVLAENLIASNLRPVGEGRFIEA